MTEQTQQATDDPSGPGWRDVELGEMLRETDMFRDGYNAWAFTENTGVTVREGWECKYRRRIEPQQPSDTEPETQPNPDDPSGPGWRDLEVGEVLRETDMFRDDDNGWACTANTGVAVRKARRKYRRRIEPPQQPEPQQPSDSEPEPQPNPDDPSGPGWRDVGPDEVLQTGDMFWLIDHWEATQNVGTKSFRYGNGYRRRIEQQTQQADDPSGPGWRDVEEGEILRVGDMVQRHHGWSRTRAAGRPAGAQRYRRRIEPQQPRDTEPVNAELQQLREQVATLTRERDRYQSWLKSDHKAGQEALAESLQKWLRPVLELVAEHPDDCSPLAVAVLGYLPGIASRLIEE